MQKNGQVSEKHSVTLVRRGTKAQGALKHGVIL